MYFYGSLTVAEVYEHGSQIVDFYLYIAAMTMSAHIPSSINLAVLYPVCSGSEELRGCHRFIISLCVLLAYLADSDSDSLVGTGEGTLSEASCSLQFSGSS